MNGDKTNMIRLSKSCIGKEEKNAVIAVLDCGFLGMGQEVKMFEEELQSFIGTEKNVVCVNTGTAALHLALLCMDIGPGDEVLVPTITYVASFQAISATGATPIACDVLQSSVFIDVVDAEKRITKKTRAIMPVHYASNSYEIPDVYDLALKYDLRIIEDAAHSFGCVRDNNRIGFDGDVVCFSFDGIKNITSGEGGAIVTGDQSLANRIKDARLLGVKRDTEKRFLGQRSWNFDVESQGFRYHMSDIMASIGRVQLKRFDELASARRELAKKYVYGLSGHAELRLLNLNYDEVVPHIFPVFFSSLEIRDRVQKSLLDQNVEVGIHYQPNHKLSYYRDTIHSFPIAEKLFSEMLTLPMHPSIDEDQVQHIINTVIFAIRI